MIWVGARWFCKKFPPAGNGKKESTEIFSVLSFLCLAAAWEWRGGERYGMISLIFNKKEATAMRILVVEDEADLNLLLCKVLTKAGYTVDGCLDGEDAQAHLLGAAYDGILLDVMLPKKDGYTLVRELRDQGNDTPVLFLTARDSVADRVKGLDLGGDDYLVKPFDFAELLGPYPGHDPQAGGPAHQPVLPWGT